MWAAFSDGASLTPSPVMATTSPSAFSALTILSFCSGMMRAKTFAAPMSRLSSASSMLSSASPVMTLPRVEPRLPGDGGRGFRIVAGDHDDPNAGRSAFLHRRGSAGPQGIGKAHETDEIERKLARRSRQLAGVVGGSRNAQNPQPLGRHFLDAAASTHRVPRRQDGKAPRWLRARLSRRQRAWIRPPPASRLA